MQYIIKTLLLIVSACMALSLSSSGQSFSKLFDYDSSSDGGSTILLKKDNSYMVFGYGGNRLGRPMIGNMHVSADGTHLISKREFDYGLQGVYLQTPGRLKALNDSTYYSQMIFQGYSPNAPDSFFSMGAFVEFNSQGDTILYKTYNDTPQLFKEYTYDCIHLTDGHFVIGGFHFKYGDYDSALLRCLDSAGNLLWVRGYKRTLGANRIQSLEQLPDGRILVGAHVEYFATKILSTNPNELDYYIRRPWFAILDASTGNILRDTFYNQNSTTYNSSKSYIGGGNIFRDRKNGGYFHWGIVDSFFTLNPNDVQNQPSYIAHLDTNFNFTWKHLFVDSLYMKGIINVKQLIDGSYLVIGAYGDDGTGWASKISSLDGAVIWTHLYNTDTLVNGYLTDAVELPDKDIVFTGQNGIYKNYQYLSDDTWVLRVDSNGCEVPGCYRFNTAIPATPAATSNEFKVYPNPTTGSFIAEVSVEGMLKLYDVNGKVVGAWLLKTGKNELSMPGGLSSGLYFARVEQTNGEVQYVKLVYQP